MGSVAYERHVTLLADGLEAVYRSRWSFQTVRAVGVAEDETHRVWVRRPDRLRAEHDGQAGTSVIVRSRPLWWMWHPDHGGVSGDDREVGLGHTGELTHLLDPTPLLGVARLEELGEEETMGRRAVRLRAEPRTAEDVIEPGWHVTAEGLELLIDLERGVALSAGSTTLTEVAFDEEIPPETFVLRFPARTTPKDSRIVPPRPIELSEASSLLGFTILLPAWLPEGTRLVRSLVPGGDPPDGLHLGYVVDPGALHTIEIAQGPRVIEEEPTAWSDWRTTTRNGVELRVREDRSESWHRAMVLVEREGTGAMVSSDLPLESVVRIGLSLEPAP